LKKKDSVVNWISILAIRLLSLTDFPPAKAQVLKEIRIGTSDVTSTDFSIYYAKDRRFFEREGKSSSSITRLMKEQAANRLPLLARLISPPSLAV